MKNLHLGDKAANTVTQLGSHTHQSDKEMHTLQVS